MFIRRKVFGMWTKYKNTLIPIIILLVALVLVIVVWEYYRLKLAELESPGVK